MLRDSLIVYDDGTPRTKHVTTNIAIEIDEEAGKAETRSYFTVLQALPGLALQPIVSGRYQDRFARHHRVPTARREDQRALGGGMIVHVASISGCDWPT